MAVSSRNYGSRTLPSKTLGSNGLIYLNGVVTVPNTNGAVQGDYITPTGVTDTITPMVVVTFAEPYTTLEDIRLESQQALGSGYTLSVDQVDSTKFSIFLFRIENSTDTSTGGWEVYWTATGH